jgi:Lon protease-like protein
VFPLPGLVLFPRTMMPLHIFEPRYIRMVNDALASDGRLVMGHLRRGWEKDWQGRPPIHRVATLARILREEPLPDGRYNLLVEGIERIEIVEEVPHTPYRRVVVESRVDRLDDADRLPLAEAVVELTELCRRVARHLPAYADKLRNLENIHVHPSIIADHVAALLVSEPYDRQSLLEQTRVVRRVALLNVQLRGLLGSLGETSPIG